VNRPAKGALIGGAVGGLVAIAQTVRAEDDPPKVVVVHAARGAAQGALVGGLVGWVIDLTSELSTLKEYGDAARDAISGAVETAEHAYEVARPKVEYAVEVALPVVEQAAELAVDLAEAARRRTA
jgi:hypothetical protein